MIPLGSVSTLKGYLPWERVDITSPLIHQMFLIKMQYDPGSVVHSMRMKQLNDDIHQLL